MGLPLDAPSIKLPWKPSSIGSMHLPDSVGEKATKATKKKPLEAVSIFGSAGTVLEEFGITESGNEIQCYVQVSPGDTITLGFELPWSDGQIVDIFVDGILRETNVTTSRPVNIHRGKIVNVCACEIRPSGAKGKLEYCDMVVEDRKTTNGNFSVPCILLLVVSIVWSRAKRLVFDRYKPIYSWL